ncbi:MAG: MFS transporter [Geminicoccaceae bacterium]|nr:MFS transporter [Geminicoccaceae bacterium]MCX8101100.1 MFS transporter [Geminicoccaceae bacterium]MDW8369946.1 MFS transporter [Geminicoccaceae bacterium]
MNRPILLLAAAGFFAAGTTRVTDALLPDIAASFAVSIPRAAVAITAFTFAYGLFQLLYGPVGARIGPFRTVALMTALTALTTALSALAPSLAWLAAARLVSGLTCAAIIPMSMAFIGDTVPYERRQPVLARFLTGHISGLVAGQAAAGLLAELVSWRTVFLFLGAGFGVVAVFLARELARGGVPNRPPEPTTSPILQYARVLRVPWARVVLVTVTLEGLFCFGAVAYVGAFLREAFLLPYALIGLVLAAFGLGGLVYALSVRRLLALLGEVGLAAAGGGVMACAFALLALAPTAWLAAPASALCGLGYYMLHNTLQTNATQMAPFDRSAAIALFAFGLFVGQAVGAALFGLALPALGYRGGFSIAALALLLIGLAFARAKRRATRAG